MVRKDGPITEASQLAGGVIAVALISCAENSLRIALLNAGLNPQTAPVEADNDVQLIHMPIPEQVTFPQGIDGVCPWAFSPEFMIWEAKNARRLLDINTVYPSCYVHRFLHTDIVNEVPDVARLVVEAWVEADMYMRLHPRETARLYTTYEPFVEAYSEYFIYSQIVGQFTKGHPHKQMIYPDLMAQTWGGPVSDFLWDAGRTKRPLTPADWRAQCDDQFMIDAYKTLGWTYPDVAKVLEPMVKAGTVSTNDEMIQYIIDNSDDIKAGKLPVRWDTPFERPFKDPFPLPGDLEKDWYYAGQWYDKGELGSITKTVP
jgi:sulfonate transport system substrate-binding protein